RRCPAQADGQDQHRQQAKRHDHTDVQVQVAELDPLHEPGRLLARFTATGHDVTQQHHDEDRETARVICPMATGVGDQGGIDHTDEDAPEKVDRTESEGTHQHSTHGPGEAQHHHHRVGVAGPTPLQPASVLCLDHVQRGQTRDHHDAERQTEPRKPQRHTGQGEHDRDEYQRMHPPVLLVVVLVVFVVFVGLGTVAAEVVTEAVTATTPEPAQQTTTCFLVVVLLHLLGAVRAIT